MGKISRYVLVIWFAALVGGPLGALLLGVREGLIENRALAPVPVLTWRSLLDAGTYRGITAAFKDRVPFRSDAVRWNARIALDVFGESSNPRIGVGEDGWLFWRARVRRSCEDETTVDETVSWIEAIGRAVEASGRRFLFFFPPPKAVAYPEFLGPLTAEYDCVRVFYAQLHARFRELPGHVDVSAVLAAEKPSSSEPLYFSHDPHWTDHSAASAAREIVERLRPGLWDPAAVHVARRRKVGFYTKMLGMPYSIEEDRVRVSRTNIDLIQLDKNDQGNLVRYSSSGSGEVIPLRAFMIHDSFFKPVRRMIAPYFVHSTSATWRRSGGHLEETAQAAAEADIVIVERAGFFTDVLFAEWRPFAQILARHLRSEPVSQSRTYSRAPHAPRRSSRVALSRIG